MSSGKSRLNEETHEKTRLPNSAPFGLRTAWSPFLVPAFFRLFREHGIFRPVPNLPHRLEVLLHRALALLRLGCHRQHPTSGRPAGFARGPSLKGLAGP